MSLRKRHDSRAALWFLSIEERLANRQDIQAMQGVEVALPVENKAAKKDEKAGEKKLAASNEKTDERQQSPSRLNVMRLEYFITRAHNYDDEREKAFSAIIREITCVPRLANHVCAQGGDIDCNALELAVLWNLTAEIEALKKLGCTMRPEYEAIIRKVAADPMVRFPDAKAVPTTSPVLQLGRR